MSTTDPLPGFASRASVRVREVRPDDALEVAAFYAHLSPESRRRRFLGFGPVDAGRLYSLCGPDHVHAEGFVAELLGGPDDERIVGHLCLEPVGDLDEELGVAVADAHQHSGVGRQLLAAAIAWARPRGIRVIRATALADNVAVMHLLTAASAEAEVKVGPAGTVEIELPITSAMAGSRRAPR